MNRKRRPLSDRFTEKVDRSGGPDACWPWTGSRKESGHGEVGSGGRRGRILKAHRVAWELAYGPIPEGMKVCHKCDNPPCCNPTHLFLGTQADNMADMARKGRANRTSRLLGDAHPLRINPHLAARGERVGGARLTEADVCLILSSNESQRALARRFGVSRRTVAFVQQRKTWRHVEAGRVVVR